MRAAAIHVVILLALSEPAGAQRLPIRIYTTADGLGSPAVLGMLSDSRGFLWFATRNGLSRFDGSEFRTYTTDDGLPHPAVNSVLETTDGEYWIATNGAGVCRLLAEKAPASRAGSTPVATASPRRPLFECLNVGSHFMSNRVNALFEDRQRRIWLGTDRGLYQLHRESGAWLAEPVRLEGMAPDEGIMSIQPGDDGRIWIGLGSGFLRVDADRRTCFYTVEGYTLHGAAALLEHNGVAWVGLRFGLLSFAVDRRPAGAAVVPRKVLKPRRTCFSRDGTGQGWPTREGDACLSDAGDGLPHKSVNAFLREANGRLWIGTSGGLAYADGARLTSLAISDTPSASVIWRLGRDRDGQVWLGTTTGAMKLTTDGLVSYGAKDGLGHPHIRTFLEHPGGGIFAVSSDWVVNRFEGTRFSAVRPQIPEGATLTYYSRGAFLDRTGRWWLITDHGLHRLRAAATIEQAVRQRAEAVYRTEDGLPNNEVVRLFEDSHGDIWIANRSAASAANLSRWDRTTGRFQVFRDGFGAEHQLPTAFAEDRLGGIWIGFEGGGLARYANRRFTIFGTANGVPQNVTGLYVDGSGRLWIASSSAGLRVLDDVTTDAPRFSRYTTAEGLSTNNIQCLTGDTWGRLYLGTARGVDRLDPASGRVKRLTTSDGLAADYVTAAFRDREGTVWFGTTDGVSRLVPGPDAPSVSPPVWIGEVRIAGAVLQTPELGASTLADLRLDPRQNHLQVAFFGVGFGAGGPLRYRYRLDGIEPGWTGPTDRRVVNYARLASGRYRFVVEAVNADGVVSSRPAVVSFTVLPPVWQRWWFLSLAGLAIAAGLYAVYRYRVGHLLELERMRTRIAADLHDDLGGSLSRIALQSEVARRDVVEQAGPSSLRLAQIGDTARTLVEALGDVVWSVDPVHDDLASVERRVREYAADVLGAHGVRWTFHGSEQTERIVLDPQARRDLLLLLKEGVTNIARHAEARAASLHLRVEAGVLYAELRDDGRGFDAEALDGRSGPTHRGLANMRARGRQLGGRLDIQSRPGHGTRLILCAPLKARKRMTMRLRRTARS